MPAQLSNSPFLWQYTLKLYYDCKHSWQAGKQSFAREKRESSERNQTAGEDTRAVTVSAGKLKRSVDPLVSGGGIDQLEGCLSALLKDVLGIEAPVLVVTVGGHAGTELLEVIGTLLLEDVLARGTLIFSFEAARRVRMLRGGELTR